MGSPGMTRGGGRTLGHSPGTCARTSGPRRGRFEGILGHIGQLAWLFAVALGAATCSAQAEPRTCLVHADCDSGTCRPDGTCAPAQAPDGGADISARWQGDATRSGAPDTAAGGDATTPDGHVGGPDAGAGTGSDTGGATPDAAPSGSCKPNHDGTITAAEAPYGPNLAARFRVASNATVDLKGTALAGGQRAWDLSAKLTGDQDVLVKTLPLDGQWFASYFKGASYVAPMEAAGDLLGVFEVTSDALLLRGVASKDGGLFATRLAYDPPIALLAFPLKPGAKWQVKASVSGLAKGVIAAYSENYESEVDASGTVKTPYGTFPTLRVRTVMKRQIALLSTTVRSFLFATECFGTVAAVRAKDDEPQAEFTQAAELRRLTP